MFKSFFSEFKFFYKYSASEKDRQTGPFFAIALFLFVSSFPVILILGIQSEILGISALQIGFYVLPAIVFIFSASIVFRNVYQKIRSLNRKFLEETTTWQSDSLFKVSDQYQGVSSLVFAPNELGDWFKNTEEKIYRFYDETRKSRAPAFIVEALANSHKSFTEVIQLYENAPDKSLELLNGLLDRKLLCIPESHFGEYIYVNKVKSGKRLENLQERLLCYAMFFSGEVRGETKPLSTYLDELYSRYDNLIGNGIYKVMFDLTSNNAVIRQKLENELQQAMDLRKDLERTLEYAKAKLKLVPVAKRWQRSARISSFLALVGLAPFLLLLVGLPLLIWFNRIEIGNGLHDFFYTTDIEKIYAVKRWTDFFTNAPWATLVFITVPVLMFAWTLKHFSRIFVQNMNLASDLSRRAALADVYSNVVSDPTLNNEHNSITDEQKKIIFEAMFRPRDPRHTDEGIDHTPVEKLIETGRGKKR